MLSKENRNGIALGLVAGIVITVLTMLSLDAINHDLKLPANGSDVEATETEMENTPKNTGAEYWLTRLVSLEDTSAQWLMTVFSAVAAALLWHTLRATQRVAADTEAIGQAQATSYLGISECGFWIDQARQIAVIQPKIKNSGQSPPINTELTLHLLIGRVADDKFVTEERWEAFSPPDLAPGEVYEIALHLGGFAIDPNIYGLNFQGIFLVRLEVCTFWDNVFEKEQVQFAEFSISYGEHSSVITPDGMTRQRVPSKQYADGRIELHRENLRMRAAKRF